MAALRIAPAAQRNTAPILGVLEFEYAGMATVLEIGSGTGQHAVAAAAALPGLVWQPTDIAERLADIAAQVAAAELANVRAPLLLDVRRAAPPGRFDAVFTANTLHIIDEDGVRRLVALAAGALRPGGRLACYGPFRRSGRLSTPSNSAFDASLRAGGVGMGIRDLEWIDSLCAGNGLDRIRTYAMPANNLLVIWDKTRD